MKKILVVTMLLLSFIGYSQLKTPYLYVVEKDTLGVVMSVADAQKLDNDGDLLKLYEQLSGSYDKSGMQYVVIIDKMNKQIAILKVEIEEYKSTIQKQEVIIADLKTIIANKLLLDAAYEKELDNANKQNQNLKKQLNKSFWQKVGGGAVALVVIGFLIVK